MLSAPLTDGGGAPRLVAAAMEDGADVIALAPEAGGLGGTYTLASGEGNGTDFLP
jgi:hypothetical protein